MEPERSPPTFVPYSFEGHTCAIPHYLTANRPLESLSGGDRFYTIKVGREVGLHINE
jgi:hypothetical protein